MTENEAIESLNEKYMDMEYYFAEHDCYPKEYDAEFQVAMATAMKALKEIQQYRSIGTVKYFKECADILNKTATDELAKIIDEWILYHKIGTVEECRDARERQKGKKPILCMNEVSGMFVDYADGHGEYKTQMNNWWRCPCCNEVVGQRVIVHKRIHDQRKKKFCEKCGQAISWESDAQ